MTEEVLSVAERIRRRRELRDQNGAGAEVVRQPRVEETVANETVDKSTGEVLDKSSAADVISIDAVNHIVTGSEETVNVQDTIAIPTRRRELAPPVPRPANAVDTPPEPTRRRRVVTEAELTPAAAEQPVKAEEIKEIVTLAEYGKQLGIPMPESRMERVVEQARSASQGLIIGLLEHMRAGEQLLITRDGEGLWSIVLPTSVVGSYEVKVAPSGQPVAARTVTKGRLPNDFEDSLRNPAYNDFQAKWRSWNLDQKVAHANELNAPLPPDGTDPKVYNMRLMMSVLATAGLAKYKPEYATQSARAAAKDKALKGIPY